MALLVPLLDALDVMHQAHCYHRDIAPDNILLLDEAAPAAARLRRRAPRDRRHDAGADRVLEAGLRADRAVRRDAVDEAGPVDRPVRARLGAALRDRRPHAAGVGGAPGQRRHGAADARRRRALQRALSARDRSCARRAPARPAAERGRDAARPRHAGAACTRRASPGDIPTAPQPFDSRPAYFDDDATRPPESATIVPLQARPRSLPEAPAAAPARRTAAALWIGGALAASTGVGLWWLVAPPPAAAPPAAAPAAASAPRTGGARAAAPAAATTGTGFSRPEAGSVERRTEAPAHDDAPPAEPAASASANDRASDAPPAAAIRPATPTSAPALQRRRRTRPLN